MSTRPNNASLFSVLSFALGFVACVPPPAAPAPNESTQHEAPVEATAATESPKKDEDAWSKTTVPARPAFEKSKNAKIARVSRTEKSALKKLGPSELAAAMQDIKAGMPWDEATKRIVTELGPPTYSLAPGEKNTSAFLFDEQWWWIGEGKNGFCGSVWIAREKDKVRNFDSAGSEMSYLPQGREGHVAEPVAGGNDESAGFLHVCEGLVTEKSR